MPRSRLISVSHTPITVRIHKRIPLYSTTVQKEFGIFLTKKKLLKLRIYPSIDVSHHMRLFIRDGYNLKFLLTFNNNFARIIIIINTLA